MSAESSPSPYHQFVYFVESNLTHGSDEADHPVHDTPPWTSVTFKRIYDEYDAVYSHHVTLNFSLAGLAMDAFYIATGTDDKIFELGRDRDATTFDSREPEASERIESFIDFVRSLLVEK